MSIKSEKVLTEIVSHLLWVIGEQLEADYVLTEDYPTRSKHVDVAINDPGISTDAIVVMTLATSKDVASVSVSATNINEFEKDDKTVHGHLLNHMIDSLFVV